LKIAEQISAQAPLAVRLSKIALNQAAGAIDASQMIEMLAQAICFGSDEKTGRMEAFLSKRAKS
jgi:1,4-dihydroxy-2-naphthoyl-CoA synthase